MTASECVIIKTSGLFWNAMPHGLCYCKQEAEGAMSTTWRTGEEDCHEEMNFFHLHRSCSSSHPSNCCSIKQMLFVIDGIHILRFGLCILGIIERQNKTTCNLLVLKQFINFFELNWALLKRQKGSNLPSDGKTKDYNDYCQYFYSSKLDNGVAKQCFT